MWFKIILKCFDLMKLSDYLKKMPNHVQRKSSNIRGSVCEIFYKINTTSDTFFILNARFSD